MVKEMTHQSGEALMKERREGGGKGGENVAVVFRIVDGEETLLEEDEGGGCVGLEVFVRATRRSSMKEGLMLNFVSPVGGVSCS